MFCYVCREDGLMFCYVFREMSRQAGTQAKYKSYSGTQASNNFNNNCHFPNNNPSPNLNPSPLSYTHRPRHAASPAWSFGPRSVTRTPSWRTPPAPRFPPRPSPRTPTTAHPIGQLPPPRQGPPKMCSLCSFCQPKPEKPRAIYHQHFSSKELRRVAGVEGTDKTYFCPTCGD